MIVATAMISFKRQYIFLGTLLFAGLAIALSTLLGVDPRIGWIGAGFTIGVQVAIHMQRSAEVRFNRIVGEMKLESGNGSLMTENIEAPSISVHFNEPANSERPEPELEPAAAPSAGVVVQLNSYNETDAANAGERETDIQPEVARSVGNSSPRCDCACGCELGSNGGFEGLCGDCRSSRLQEALACECDYTTSTICTCGVVQHKPLSVESDLIAAG